jgi:hypothetical protein
MSITTFKTKALRIECSANSWRGTMKKNRIIAFSACLLFGFSGEATRAAESFKPIGPIGGTDIRQAFLPPPGLYGVGVGVVANVPRYWAQDQTFASSATPVIGGVGLLYVYDTELWGGKLGSTIFEDYANQNFGLDGTKKSSSKGFGDIYSDVLMWSRFFPSEDYGKQSKDATVMPYGLQVLVGLGMNFPVGKYNPNKKVNVGSNVYTFSPNIALTYTTPSIFYDAPGHATEFSARFFYNTYTKNHDTDYLTAPTASVDFAVTERVNQWQFGIAGTAFTQVADDKVHGQRHPNDGNRASYLSLGPVVSYDFVAAEHHWNVTAKGVIAVAGQNTGASSAIIVRLATKLN